MYENAILLPLLNEILSCLNLCYFNFYNKFVVRVNMSKMKIYNIK